MKIYNHIDLFQKVDNAIITLGTFDGVHKGHKVIINRLKQLAQEINGEVVVLTFFPHPRMVLFPDDHGLQLLNTIEERTNLMAKAGIEHLIIHPFSKEFSRLSSTEFVRDMLVNKLGVKKLVIGYDHHFGRNREGSFSDLEELAPVYNFEVERIPEQDVNEVAVSSTKIRHSLLAGDVATAREFLGYDYELTGTVIHGKKLGRSLGFPTANLHIKEDYKLIPANGIYAARAIVKNQLLNGVMSIGNRPTFDNGERSIEINLFDFDDVIYGEKITLQMVEYIRKEEKFGSETELIAAMNKDKVEAVKLLS
ncbi:MAG: bifunctional riboflavin kinase/FAD synthetase [Bacteroidetes bacterium]|nr:bifunctional riboflavin kinase/FAD synthetase [Bacteroidota bacterium]